MNEKTFWCIVSYLGAAPMYYQGWYGINDGETEMKPAIGFSFDDALKFHSKEAAEFVFRKLHLSDAKVEEHAYFDTSILATQ